MKNKWMVAALLIGLCALTYALFYQRSTLRRLESDISLIRTEKEILVRNLDSLRSKFNRLELEIKTSRYRQLPFLQSPQYDSLERNQLEDKLIKEFNREYQEGELLALQKSLVKFGFIDDKYHLEKGYLDLLEEQVGAFYDTQEKKLYHMKDLPLSSGLQQAVTVHELTHALQDQHYHIQSLMKGEDKNDDAELARHALIEGDATLNMQFYYLRSLNWAFLWDIITSLFIHQEELKKAPSAIRDNLLFPYTSGLSFSLFLYEKDGWKSINQAYLDLPQSTEEILHPSKYLLKMDRPKAIQFPKIEGLKNFKMTRENVMGEFNLFLLFKKFLSARQAKTISEGWGADRYQIWENEQTDRLGLIWLLTWDTAPDANEFFRSYPNYLDKRYVDVKEIQVSDRFALFETSDGYVAIALNGSATLVIDLDRKELIDPVRISFDGFQDSAYNA